MNAENLIHPKIVASIASCAEYQQLATCMNFTKFYPDDISAQLVILSLVQEKLYQMRNKDLAEHKAALKTIMEKSKFGGY